MRDERAEAARSIGWVPKRRDGLRGVIGGSDERKDDALGAQVQPS